MIMIAARLSPVSIGMRGSAGWIRCVKKSSHVS